MSWCIGHLISLADAATYNEQYRKWKYDDLPIVPQDWQFTVASGKEQQFSVLKDLMQRSDVSEIVNACDSGREGELIFRFVYEQVNCQKPFSRLWISSMGYCPCIYSVSSESTNCSSASFSSRNIKIIHCLLYTSRKFIHKNKYRQT